MRRWLLLAAVVAACAQKPQARCREVEVAQETLPDRVPTCRSSEMHTALGLCGLHPAVYPAGSSRNGPLKESWDISVDDCLREWVKVFDTCADEPDRQFKCMPAR